jgi:hypothetical protein
VGEVISPNTRTPEQEERLQRAIDEAQRNAPVFTWAPGDPLAGEHALLDEVIREWRVPPFAAGKPEWHQTTAGRGIVQASPREQVAVMHAALERSVWAARDAATAPAASHLGSPNFLMGWIADHLLCAGLPLDTADRRHITETLLALGESFLLWNVPIEAAVARVAEGFAVPGADEALRPGVLRLRKLLIPLAYHDLDRRGLTAML